MAGTVAAETHHEKADKFASCDNYVEACKEYQKAVEINRADVLAFVGWGDALYHRRNYLAAIEKYLKAIELDPNSVDYDRWAEAYQKLTKEEQAKKSQEFRKAASGNSQPALAYRNWGDALRETEGYSDAAEKYKTATHIDPADGEAYCGWALCLLRLEKYQDAVRKCQKAVQAKSPCMRGHAYWATALAHQEKYPEAIEQYLIAISLDLPNPGLIDYEGWNSAFQALPASEQEATADKLQQIVDQKPEERAYTYLLWGNVLGTQQKYAEASEKYEKAAKALPSSPEAYTGWASALYQQGKQKYPEAIEKYLKAVELGSNWIDYDNWNSALQALPDQVQTAAVEKLQRIVDSKPELTRVFVSWGDGLYAEKKYPEAIEKYLKAIDLGSDSINYDNWNSAFQALRENEQKATAEGLQRIVESKPNLAGVYVGWGYALYLQKNYSEASQKYEKAAKQLPPAAGAYTGWADALYQQGKELYPAAIEKYLKALELDPNSIDSVDYRTWNSMFEALSEREQKATVEKLQQILDKYPQAVVEPDDAGAYVRLGKTFFLLQKYSEAIEQFLKAAELDLTSIEWDEWIEALDKLPKDEQGKQIEKMHQAADNKAEAANAYANWGDGLQSRKKNSEAIEKYRRASELNSELFSAFLGWARVLNSSGRYAESDEKYQKVIQLDPDNENSQAEYAYIYWGITLYARRRYADAIDKYRKAIEFNRSNAMAYVNWGDALYGQKLFAESVEQYGKAAETGQQDVNAYLQWAAALVQLGNDSAAKEKYEQALKIEAQREPSLAERYFYWGNALVSRNRIQEAIDKYRQAIRLDGNHAYSHHNLASYLEWQGKYGEARSKWDEAIKAYEHGRDKAKTNNDVDYFRYYGSVFAAQRRIGAEEVYREGLELNPNHVDILADLVDLYLEQKDELLDEEGRPDREARTSAYFKAREVYRKAEEILKPQLRDVEDATTFLQLGSLCLSMEEYDEAEKHLSKALEKDRESADACNKLGALYTRKKDFQKAIEYFRKALGLEPDDLKARSNLAEAYLKANLPDKAEDEYTKILGITAYHVESEIGLGQVYTAMAEAGDKDLYEEAVHHFRRAIEIAKNSPSSASKKLKPKEWAAVYYSTGYARVKLYETSKLLKDERLLRQARNDFIQCRKCDPEYYKAERALRKMKERLRPYSPERLLEKWGPAAILIMSGFVFGLAQVSYLKRGKFYDLPFYVSVTFGSIVLMIAGLFLPALSKLKVPGMELEKSSVDQITTSGSLEISK